MKKLTKAGINVIALSMLPATLIDTDLEKIKYTQVNDFIKYYSYNNSKIHYIDWQHIFVEPLTGLPNEDSSLDGTHPNRQAAIKLGKYLSEKLSIFINKVDLLPTSALNTNNFVNNGFMLGDVSGLATSWTNGGLTTVTFTKEKVARTDGIVGEWQQFNVTGQGNLYFYQSAKPITGIFNVGDKIFGMMEFENIGNFEGLTGYDFYINCMDSSSSTIGILSSMANSGNGIANIPIEKGILKNRNVRNTRKYYTNTIFL